MRSHLPPCYTLRPKLSTVQYRHDPSTTQSQPRRNPSTDPLTFQTVLDIARCTRPDRVLGLGAKLQLASMSAFLDLCDDHLHLVDTKSLCRIPSPCGYPYVSECPRCFYDLFSLSPVVSPSSRMPHLDKPATTSDTTAAFSFAMSPPTPLSRLVTLNDTLTPPPMLPVAHSPSSSYPTSSRETTRIDLTNVITPQQLPSTFRIANPTLLLRPFEQSLTNFVADINPSFGLPYPDDWISAAADSYWMQRTTMNRYWMQHTTMNRVKACMSRPLGEAGLSDQLGVLLFDRLNDIAARYFVAVSTREWKPIGMGGVGKTDWGLFVNGTLRVIVGLKPSSVGGTVDEGGRC